MLHVVNMMGWVHCVVEEVEVDKVVVAVEQDGMMMVTH